MRTVFIFAVWVIFEMISILGFISLITLNIIADNAWKRNYALRMSSLKRYVTTQKSEVKSLLFEFGLTYLEVRDRKMVYFIFSTIALIVSLILVLVIKTSFWTLWMSICLLLLNIIFYYGTRHDMKKFYSGEKEKRNVFYSLENFPSEPE